MDSFLPLAFFGLLDPTLATTGTADGIAQPTMEIVMDAPAEANPGDPFGALAPMEQESLRDASGGSANYAVDLDAYGINIADSDAAIDNTTIQSGQTGAIDGTNVTGNAGITTVFINSGNGVVFQNTLQVNVYTATGTE